MPDSVPYSTVELSGLTPDSVRALLAARGITAQPEDETLREAIGLYLTAFFEPYAGHDITYDAAGGRLLYLDTEIGAFYGNNPGGTFQTLTGYGDGGVTVFIERDARGKLLDVTVFDEAGEMLANFSK